MCGLAGAAGTLINIQGQDDTKTFRELLFVSAFRGVDSTGIVGRNYRDDPGDVAMFKATVNSADFLEMDKVKDMIGHSDQFIIGHCRSRTVGELNKKNAQPFDFPHIVGTHNGTLDWSTKNRLEGQGVICGTDSEALYHRMNREGLAATLGLTDEDDAMALVWYNKDENSLNFYRNKHRPLHYVYDDKRKRIFWASEAGMLYLILNRNKVAFEKVRLLPENVHFKLVLPEQKGEKLGKPETRILKQPKAPLFQRSAAQSARVFTAGAGHNSTSTCGAEILCLPVANAPRQAWNSGISTDVKLPVQPDMLKPGAEPQKYDRQLFLMDRLIVRPDKLGGSYYRSSKTGHTFDTTQFEHKMSPGCCECGVSPIWGEPVRFMAQDENVMCASCISEAQADARTGRWEGNALSLLTHFG